MAEMGNELSLIGCMSEIPDPRAPYNQKHKFLDILIIAVTAILCGMRLRTGPVQKKNGWKHFWNFLVGFLPMIRSTGYSR